MWANQGSGKEGNAVETMMATMEMTRMNPSLILSGLDQAPQRSPGSFDPDAPVTGFHFADTAKLTDSEFEGYATQLHHGDVPEKMIAALRRGIGVHHAGLNRKYRQVCEILFRKRYLRVVIATGTLVLGINMPCKTVVFSGDSVFLTALGFRQAAGRAGRRGFDFLGNVVFQNISHTKACRLLSSNLPDLNGHFPLTTSLVLRLLILLHESKGAPYAVKTLNSILSCPRIYLGGEESKHTVLHHLRFKTDMHMAVKYIFELERRAWRVGRAPVTLEDVMLYLQREKRVSDANMHYARKRLGLGQDSTKSLQAH